MHCLFRSSIKLPGRKGTTGSTATGTAHILQAEELIIQRLSSDVQGSAQKYKKISARVFVSFYKYSEVTIANIKDALLNMSNRTLVTTCNVIFWLETKVHPVSFSVRSQI